MGRGGGEESGILNLARKETAAAASASLARKGLTVASM